MVLGSVEAVNRSLLERVALNRAILDNAYWRLPVDDRGHENFVPVGRGRRTSDFCGRWVSFLVCDNVETHKGVVLKGVDYTGKLAVTHEHLWCNRSSCPVCFIRGWSLRVACAVVGRLDVAHERGYGDVEHFSVSVPKEDYGLPEPVLREKCRVAMSVRGVLGGGMIFHGFRQDRSRKVLVWSPHYHALGFIRGGFDVCRNCVHERVDCRSCSCFKGREAREYAKDRYLVKVFDKRENVFGTAFYQLNHATLRVGVKRFHVVTWFGVCGCSKLKGRKVKALPVCVVCDSVGVHSEMVKRAYWGDEVIARDIGDPNYNKLFAIDEFKPNGLPMFANAGGGKVE